MQLECVHINKTFPGVKALDQFSLVIRPGEIHAICGENGAGKSTFLNILTGNLQADDGQVLIDGKQTKFISPKDAFEKGIAIVYQHLSLIDSLSIAENIYGHFPPVNSFGFIQRDQMVRNAGMLLKKLHLDFISPDQEVRSLKTGEKQLVEIAKALAHHPKIIFFDEPTAAVSEKDAETVFNIIRRLKSEQVAIVYISHRLHEIFKISDVITVLKDGKGQGTYKTEEMDEKKLIRLMVGRDIAQRTKVPGQKTKPLLCLTNFCGPGFKDINITLHRGEIVGLSGLVGAGRTEIAKAIFGARKATSGKMFIGDTPVKFFKEPIEAMRKKIGYIPEDRKWNGIFGSHSVAENMYVTAIAQESHFNLIGLRKTASAYCQSLHIKTDSLDKKADELSGGNQQKLLLARWLNTEAEILILDEPTQGIDIGTRIEIYQIIRNFVEQGKAILLISSELSELLYLSDRIMVIKGGKCTAILEATDTTEEEILSMAM